MPTLNWIEKVDGFKKNSNGCDLKEPLLVIE